MKKKIIFLLGLIVIVFLAVLAVPFLSELKHDVEGVRDTLGISETQLSEREESFRKNPNLKDGMILVDRYSHLKKYEKARFYGEYCIRLDGNSGAFGWIVNLWVANACAKTGELEKSRYYLREALRLDTQNKIMRYKHIEKLGLQHVMKQLSPIR
ncbi:MAG: hypothetical protein V1736_04430 [Pseudomonadota bacterium]